MTSNPTDFPDFSTTALLIAAHGSPHSAGGTSATRSQARTLANLEIFGEVGAGFISEKPFIHDVLDDIEAAEVYIVPNLATTGYIYTDKLPKALGLTGTVTERITPRGHQRLILTPPVGTHPLIAKIMTASIQAMMKDLDLKAKDTALMVIGHGSTKSRACFEQIKKLIHEMAQFGLIQSDLAESAEQEAIFAGFLEEIPFVEDWNMQTKAKNIIFAPALISDGFHAIRDIPLAIGFDPSEAQFVSDMAQGRPSERHLNGHRLIYMPPVGTNPDMAEIIFSRVKQAHEKLIQT